MMAANLRLLAAFVVVCVVSLHAASGARPSTSVWNRDHIDWVSWSQAIPLAIREQRPIMMVVHKTWCATCRQVGEAFGKSAEIEMLSKYFVMADVEDDDEPSDKKYAVQGQYNPRILFLYPNGDVADIVNERGGDPAHLHFYPEVPDLIRSMLQALKSIGGIADVNEL